MLHYLEGQSVDDMTDACEASVFVSRARVDVDANAREVTGERVGGDADAIIKSGNLFQLGRVLRAYE